MNQPIDDGGPAFPVSWGQHDGLSMRDVFAMMPLSEKEIVRLISEIVSETARTPTVQELRYWNADRMIYQRKKAVR